MKKCTVWIITLLCLLSLMGCGAETAPAAPDPSASSADGTESLPFQEGQLYAAAYLGYGGTEDLSYYTQTCLNGAEPPGKFRLAPAPCLTQGFDFLSDQLHRLLSQIIIVCTFGMSLSIKAPILDTQTGCKL